MRGPELFSEHSASRVDCFVIGGGPAGSAAAALVAREGYSTWLVERERVPRFHVGESLMPETFWTLRRLGVIEKLKQAGFTPKIGVQFIGGSGRASQPFYFDQHDPRDCSKTWHVERAEFDRILFEHAADCGAHCMDETRVLDVEFLEEGGAKLQLRDKHGAQQTVFARVVVDASGQQSFLANRLDLKVDNPKLRKAAIWGHFEAARREEHETNVTSIIHTQNKEAWFWYIPIREEKVSIGLVSDRDSLFSDSRDPAIVFEQFRQRCPGLLERTESARLVGELHVAREFSYTTRQHAGAGWVLVGDAYGFLDPIYSTGVFLALKSGELAADAIVEGLRINQLTEAQLGKWTREFDEGVVLFSKLVGGFYTPEFSFADFLREHPEHQSSLTDLLIGRAFTPDVRQLMDDMDPAIRQAQSN